MPAEIVNATFCGDYWATFKVPGSKGNIYEVTLNGGEAMPHCTCPAFRFAKGEKAGDCKHIREVWKRACLWNPQWHGGGPGELKPVSYHETHVPNEKCPKCGGPVVPVRIAV